VEELEVVVDVEVDVDVDVDVVLSSVDVEVVEDVVDVVVSEVVVDSSVEEDVVDVEVDVGSGGGVTVDVGGSFEVVDCASDVSVELSVVDAAVVFGSLAWTVTVVFPSITVVVECGVTMLVAILDASLVGLDAEPELALLSMLANCTH